MHLTTKTTSNLVQPPQYRRVADHSPAWYVSDFIIFKYTLASFELSFGPLYTYSAAF